MNCASFTRKVMFPSGAYMNDVDGDVNTTCERQLLQLHGTISCILDSSYITSVAINWLFSQYSQYLYCMLV